jgi:hypothetical protein
VKRRTLLVVAGLSLLGADVSLGQCLPGGPRDPRAVRRAIVGTVLDRNNTPLENADVTIQDPRRAAKTRADGRFQLMDLDTGVYEVNVRKIGYQEFTWVYVVTDTGGVARFCLAPEVHILPPLISAVSAGGLSGVIGDSLMKALPEAEVRVMGAGRRTKTDSAGAFHMDLRHGTYAIMISKPGYARQLMSVTIPRDSGRQITAFLGSPPRNANRMAANLNEMRERMIWASPATSGIMSSEELMKSSMDLRAAAQRLARAGIADDCPAIIDGGPFVLPLSIIDKRDVAMIEAYGLFVGASSRSRRPTDSPCGARVYVWMKP